MITVTHDYKLQPNKSQIQMIETYLEACRRVYNYALQERKDWVNSRKSSLNACSIHSEYIISPDTPKPTYNSQCKSLTDAKKIYPKLNIPHSQVLQQTLRTLEAVGQPVIGFAPAGAAQNACGDVLSGSISDWRL